MVVNYHHFHRRAEGGGVAADCHAAFDVVDLVADDGRVGRVVLDHYPEAVGVINQARAVDDAVQHQQILAAAARLPEALRQYGTATDVFDGNVIDLHAFGVGELEGIDRRIARFPAHVEREFAEEQVFRLATRGGEEGGNIICLVEFQHGGAALATNVFVLRPVQHHRTDAVRTRGHVDDADIGVIQRFLQALSKTLSPFAVAQISDFIRACRLNFQQRITGAFLGAVDTQHDIVAVGDGVIGRCPGVISGRCGCRAGRCFVMGGVVVVGRLYGDFRALLRGGEGEGLRGCAANRVAISKPLVFDRAGVEVIGILDGGGQRAAHFGLARDADAARLVGRGVGGVVLHVEDEGFLRGETACVGGGNGQFYGRLGGVVEVLSGFEFQRAVACHFKARVAHAVGMRVAAVGVVRR